MIAIALVVIALNPWLTSVRALLAPRHAAGNLLAEAPDGTWREIDLRGKPPEYPKVIVQMKFN